MYMSKLTCNNTFKKIITLVMLDKSNFIKWHRDMMYKMQPIRLATKKNIFLQRLFHSPFNFVLFWEAFFIPKFLHYIFEFFSIHVILWYIEWKSLSHSSYLWVFCFGNTNYMCGHSYFIWIGWTTIQ